MGETISIGGYLAQRLQEIGVKQYFAVPGDYNLILLDELFIIDFIVHFSESSFRHS